LKEKANLLFERKQYDDAIVQYTEVLGALPPRQKKNEVEDEDVEAISSDEESPDAALSESVRILRAVVYANIAACHLVKKEYKEAVVACNESLQDDSLYLKALNRRAQANEEIGTWSSLTSSLEGEHLYHSLMEHSLTLLARLQNNEQHASSSFPRAYFVNCIEKIAWQN
jgi:tetratricopeptide (TPR) repeat protein